MAINIFEACINPVSGEYFKGTSFSHEAFVMEWIVQPKGYVPFEHIHLHQDEVFRVNSGELKICINGTAHIVAAGESITVPKGAKHTASNNTANQLNCTVTYNPGLDYNKFMQCLTGLTKDNFIDSKGGISIPRMGYCLVKMKTKSMARPTAIPAPAFKMALLFFYLRGVLSGWDKMYRSYVGD